MKDFTEHLSKRTKYNGQFIDRNAYDVILTLLEAFADYCSKTRDDPKVGWKLKVFIQETIRMRSGELYDILVTRLGISTWKEVAHVILDLSQNMGLFEISSKGVKYLCERFGDRGVFEEIENEDLK